MRNLYRILTLVLVALISVGVVAAPKKKKKKKTNNNLIHYVSMWGGTGYSGMVNNFDGQTYTDLMGVQNTFEPTYIGGGGGMLGLGYELHYKKKGSKSPNEFIFSVGPEFRFLSSKDKLDFGLGEGQQFANQFNVDRADYSSMALHYDFTGLREWQYVGQVMLPIMFGGNFDRYYFLAGAKVGWGVLNKYQQMGRLTTSVSEMQAIEDWYDVPSHDLVTEAKLLDHPLYAGPAKGNNSFGLFGGLDAALSAEFGINLNEFFSETWQGENEAKPHPWHMRLAAFIDYGIPNIWSKPTPENSLALVNATANNISTNSLYQSDWANGSRVNSLLVGVKFTALLQLNKPKQPNPYMQVRVLDYLSGQPIPAAKVNVWAPGKKKPAEVVMANADQRSKKPKATDKQAGMIKKRYAKGTYKLEAKLGMYGQYDSVSGKIDVNKPYLYYDTIPESRVIYDQDVDMVDAQTIVDLQLLPRPHVARTLHDKNTEQMLSGTLVFTDRETGRSFTIKTGGDKVANVFQTDTLLKYGHTYDVKVTASGYHDTTTVVDYLYDTDPIKISMRPVKKVRRTLILKHMYFATDKTDILPSSEDDLQILYNFLTENPRVRVLITGHTDSQGTDTYNQRLSEGRSASVKAEMVKRGIAEERMETDGKGESEPIDTNDTPEGRQNNRRVQVTVLNAEDAEVDVY